MKIVLDTCVLVPVLVRWLLLKIAELGKFTPLWSEKIFSEWQCTASKLGKNNAMRVEIEILLMKSRWKDSMVTRDIAAENRLLLPDLDDRHVLSTAIARKADFILTYNLRDFPIRTLASHNIKPRSPDSFLLEIFEESPKDFSRLVDELIEKELESGIEILSKKTFLKRSGLPRLAKSL